jgi:hypothetical protein
MKTLLVVAGVGVVSWMMGWSLQDDTWEPLSSKPTKPLSRQDQGVASRDYLEAIQKTAQMVSDSSAQRIVSKLGLNILNITWEDTGRYKNSAVGPNISDMTIQVGVRNPLNRQFEVTCMPVIRFPNFSDVTCDIDPRQFTILVGNEKGRALQRVPLYEFLAHPRDFLTNPKSWPGPRNTLLAPRDERVLVSAQACFLPVPKSGKATFNPVVFNYQSYSGDPAVLTILATREGTSVTIIDNKRDAFETGSVWGQRLFHNANGMRASLTGQRISDYLSSGTGSGTSKPSSTYSGMNMVLLIQVPLKQKRPRRMDMSGGAFGGFPASEMADKTATRGSDVEAAVIGHGDLEGPFTEIDDLAIERDPAFPVRVTVQFYKATSNGVVSELDLRQIREEIDRVYAHGEFVGSLVTGGETGRITEYYGMKVQPPGWWDMFWQRHEQNTGDTRDVAIRKLMQLLGRNYMQLPVCELYLRDLLRK